MKISHILPQINLNYYLVTLIASIYGLILGIPMQGHCRDNKPIASWTFKNKSPYDESNTYQAIIRDDAFYSLGNNQYAIRVNEQNSASMRIPVDTASPLALSSGTIAFWLNCNNAGNQIYIVRYNNQSIDLQFYRRHLTPRFRGTHFDFGTNNLDANWPEHILRESAFYPHKDAVAREGEWHHFVVSYDYLNEQIIGYRDGELIHVVDLSHLDRNIAMEPLNAGVSDRRLSEILIGEGFSGFIGELHFFDQVLSLSDVKQMYHSSEELYHGRIDHFEERPSMVYSYNEKDSTLYNGWLQYSPMADQPERDLLSLRQIVVDTDNETIKTASRELALATKQMWGSAPKIDANLAANGNVILGTYATSAIIRDLAQKGVIDLSLLKYDGYLIKSIVVDNKPSIVVAANEPGGVIFGAFALIRNIGLRNSLSDLDTVSNPNAKIRIINHWDIFRGLTGDKWLGINTNTYNSEGNRRNSMFSWADLKTGNTKIIEDWARLLSSAGWNAIAPTEINWEYRNDFLMHLDEIETLAGIFRRYGIRLFWTPNYLYALDKATADSLYKRVPDFGGYLLKLGSEAQLGDPRPAMVNLIADNLIPYEGTVLVRSFVYGKGRYYDELERVDGFRRYSLYRNTIPYAIFAKEDGNFRDNVVIVNKASPLDWDLSAPNVTPLDGAITKNMYAPEMVIHKEYPLSWVGKWKNWFMADNYRNGEGSFNHTYIDAVLGVSMISPTPGWASNPINMVNYFGLGQLAWNPNLDLDEIYETWVRLTFGHDRNVINTVKEILYKSEEMVKDLYIYRGFRGIWMDDRRDEVLTVNKTPHWLTKEGVGVFDTKEQRQILDQYAPHLQEVYLDKVASEAYLPYFNFVAWDYTLTSGRTMIQDFYHGLDNGLALANELVSSWERLSGEIDPHQYDYTYQHLELNVAYIERRRQRYIEVVGKVTGYPYEQVMNK